MIDIGGGSTEVVIGEGYEPQLLESLKLGCVSLSQRYFDDGKLSEKRFERAQLAARLELEPMQTAFLQRGWEQVVGSSGTVRAIGECLQERDPQVTGVTAEGLEALLADMKSAGDCRELGLNSLTEERRPVFPGRPGHPRRAVRALGIEQLRVAEGAMRDGLLYDMVGRFTDEDARERSVRSMEQRYHVDGAQAERVEATAVKFLAQVRRAGNWRMS